MTELGLSEAERRRVADVERLHGAGTVDALVGYLSDPSWSVRRSAIAALARLGDAAIGALCEVLRARGPDEGRLAAAVEALVASSGDADPAVLALAESEDSALVCDAAQVLGRRRCAAALPLLARLASGASDNVSLTAVEAIGRIGGHTAVNLLVAAVHSGNFFRVFPAIEVLGKTGDPRSVKPLASLLERPHYAVEAARALGHGGQDAAARPLADVLVSASDEVVVAASTALGEIHDRLAAQFGPQPTVVEALGRLDTVATSRRLVKCLAVVDAPGRAALCRVLGWVGGPESARALLELIAAEPDALEAASASLERLADDADPFLRAALRTGDPPQRLVLLPVLAKRRTPPQDLIVCLADPDADVRKAACDALGKLGDRDAVSPLFDALADADAAVSQAASVAIQSIGGEEAERRALDASSSSDVRIRRAALRVLAYFGWPSALGPLLAALGDEDERIRELGASGLSSIEDPRAVDALIGALDHEAARTRAAAARALGQTPGEPRGREKLRAALADPDTWVRYYACQALGRLKDHASVEAIRALTRDPAGHVRIAAIEALAAAGGERALEALRAAAESADPDLQRVALIGLGAVKSASSVGLVRRALSSRDEATRLVAVSALGEFDGPEVLDGLAAAMGDANESVRAAATALLGMRSGAEAVHTLIARLENEGSREPLIVALAAGPAGRIEALLDALRTATPTIAPHLVSALVRMRRADADAALEDAFDLENPAARQALAPALLALRTPSARQRVERAATSDPSTQVRQVCAALLGT
jgi:HEAT repeat protein